nr:MAG TPA: hypothetical protein [Caudoviricetes sp.]
MMIVAIKAISGEAAIRITSFIGIPHFLKVFAGFFGIIGAEKEHAVAVHFHMPLNIFHCDTHRKASLFKCVVPFRKIEELIVRIFKYIKLNRILAQECTCMINDHFLFNSAEASLISIAYIIHIPAIWNCVFIYTAVCEIASYLTLCARCDYKDLVFLKRLLKCDHFLVLPVVHELHGVFEHTLLGNNDIIFINAIFYEGTHTSRCSFDEFHPFRPEVVILRVWVDDVVGVHYAFITALNM